jgi:hypothetical protein
VSRFALHQPGDTSRVPKQSSNREMSLLFNDPLD